MNGWLWAAWTAQAAATFTVWLWYWARRRNARRQADEFAGD